MVREKGNNCLQLSAWWGCCSPTTAGLTLPPFLIPIKREGERVKYRRERERARESERAV
jgi:hypothetical protein